MTIRNKLYTRCDVAVRDGIGEVHIHSMFGRVRQVLYWSRQGDWYDAPVKRIEELLALDDPNIVAELLGREV